MALSQQLRNIANAARGQAEQQQSVGMAQVGMQAQQALGQQPTAAGPQGKQAAQQLAAGITGAQQQVATQAQAGLQQNLGQLAQQGVQQQGQARQQQLQEQQQLSEKQISDLQRQKALRQNSESLRQSKQLQQREIDLQNRLTSAKLEYDNSLSFLTRKQREDLAALGQYTKQVLFDQRLTFAKDEAGRKFTNMQQLADYAVLSAETDQQLAKELKVMQQAVEKEFMALEQAHKLITNKMQQEFERAEKQKDYAMLQKLSEYKKAIEEKMQRKRAKSGMMSNIIIGGATIAGAIIGSGMGATIPGAMVGQGLGQATTGAAQAGGVY